MIPGKVSDAAIPVIRDDTDEQPRKRVNAFPVDLYWDVVFNRSCCNAVYDAGIFRSARYACGQDRRTVPRPKAC